MFLPFSNSCPRLRRVSGTPKLSIQCKRCKVYLNGTWWFSILTSDVRVYVVQIHESTTAYFSWYFLGATTWVSCLNRLKQATRDLAKKLWKNTKQIKNAKIDPHWSAQQYLTDLDLHRKQHSCFCFLLSEESKFGNFHDKYDYLQNISII